MGPNSIEHTRTGIYQLFRARKHWNDIQWISDKYHPQSSRSRVPLYLYRAESFINPQDTEAIHATNAHLLRRRPDQKYLTTTRFVIEIQSTNQNLSSHSLLAWPRMPDCEQHPEPNDKIITILIQVLCSLNWFLDFPVIQNVSDDSSTTQSPEPRWVKYFSQLGG